MNVLKWFKQNLCSYEEFTGKTPEEKIISGKELFNQMYRLAEMEVYAFLREKNAYIWPGRVYRFANQICRVNHITNIFSNHYYKIRLKDGLNVEEYGVKAVHFERVYLMKSKKKTNPCNMKRRKTKNTNSIYRLITKKSFSENELCQLIKEIAQFNDYHYILCGICVVIPGRFFIKGKEYTDIKISFGNSFFEDRRSKKNFIEHIEGNDFMMRGGERCSRRCPPLELVAGGWYYLA